jgi:hypothetical protein
LADTVAKLFFGCVQKHFSGALVRSFNNYVGGTPIAAAACLA